MVLSSLTNGRLILFTLVRLTSHVILVAPTKCIVVAFDSNSGDFQRFLHRRTTIWTMFNWWFFFFSNENLKWILKTYNIKNTGENSYYKILSFIKLFTKRIIFHGRRKEKYDEHKLGSLFLWFSLATLNKSTILGRYRCLLYSKRT